MLVHCFRQPPLKFCRNKLSSNYVRTNGQAEGELPFAGPRLSFDPPTVRFHPSISIFVGYVLCALGVDFHNNASHVLTDSLGRETWPAPPRLRGPFLRPGPDLAYTGVPRLPVT